MNNKLPPLWLVVGLMMFPQIVETIYSPVLTHIASQFRVSDGQASQTLSVYFLAFAVGVVCWGRLCDLIGRRPAMLAGLLTYGAGSLLALLANQFETLLLARIISAFGAAVGSVVTQTMLRDSYQGSDLARVFSVMGVALSISPVLGLVSGGLLAEQLGYLGVFSGLLVLALGLTVIASWRLPETRPAITTRVALWPLACRMARDGGLWRSALLVALFNTMLFGYYSLAPFLFAGLGLNASEFGYSGLVLAIGTLIGSLLNKRLLGKGWQSMSLIRLATSLALGAGVAVCASQDSLWFLLPMMGVVVAFGIAIPNVLSQALLTYREVAGSAGALFGLAYYLLLSLGLALAAGLQDLGMLLFGCGLLAVLCSGRRST
ncbi:multidrug effflux MFS transporter [Aeromonas salmonicida]|uniref:Multidrug effflux MFS transporter n=1 Tax=Aeromonas salmonicida TaxID=645 RepID=A0AAX3VRK7_AERSA|nr:multidrug effflux MFS transporter [Aeromonas salmonicida]RSM27719.1 MFS transporter [Aeromonas salmonicida]WHF35458.1 multidrug effflux MFS transporter [Aeromonas salmonicida]HEH9394986.1 multidrug effflux MFS transporter [Aeromonas salmonicida]